MAVKHSKVIGTIGERMESSATNSGYAKKHLAEVNKMRSAVAGLEKLATSKNMKDTEGAHLSKVAKSTKRLETQVDGYLNRINDIYREGMIDIDSRIKSQAKLTPSKHAAEIRQAFRDMKPDQRSDAFNEALKNQNTEVLAAILDAPAIVSGVDDEIKNRYREAIEKVMAPEAYAEREALHDSLNSSLIALKSVRNAIKDGFDPVKLAEIDAAEQAHQEATQAFESAMSA